MICPYCASEYEGGVCPRCGGKAQAEENAIVCPYCDSVHTGGPRCNRCGADLLSIFAPPPLPEPPVGKYKGYQGYLELRKDSLVIYRKLPVCRPTEVVIPYHEIRKVVYRSAKESDGGFWYVRTWNDWKPDILTIDEAYSDYAVLDTRFHEKTDFEKVYEFLKLCVQRNLFDRALKSPEALRLGPPLGRHRGYAGYIQLDEEFVSVTTDFYGSVTTAVIPYSELWHVTCKKNAEPDGGFLSVRTREDTTRITTSKDAILDKFSLNFRSHQECDFLGVYHYLKYWVQKNREINK